MTQLTMLSNMAGNDFATGLVKQHDNGISVLDLKSGILGKQLLHLTDDEAIEADQLIKSAGMSVYCFSTELFYTDIEIGEDEFRHIQLAGVARAIELAHIMHPQVIRLLSARTRRRDELDNSIDYLRDQHPWVIDTYREAVDMISDAGFHTTIENEVEMCIFTKPREVSDFFTLLDRQETAHYTWDVQNMWGCGTYPSMTVYEQLKPYIGYYHVKGGQVGDDGHTLQWSTALEDASWPVTEITNRVINDGISPVICLNPSHGKQKPGYDYTDVYWRDIDFLNRVIRENYS